MADIVGVNKRIFEDLSIERVSVLILWKKKRKKKRLEFKKNMKEKYKMNNNINSTEFAPINKKPITEFSIEKFMF